MNNPTIEVTQADQWRKKPVVITAVQINTQEDAEGYLGICTGGTACKSKGAPDGAWPHIHTLEGDHTWTPGDWCITGVQGEQYFCKPDIFAQTYEPAHRIASTRTVDTELLEAARLALSVAESWIHDQLDGTGSVDDALAELAPVRAALKSREARHG